MVFRRHWAQFGVFALLLFPRWASSMEWIVTRPPNSAWESLLTSRPPEIQMGRSFGPNSEFAIVKGEESTVRSWLSLQRASLQIQPNFSYRALAGSDPQVGQSWALENSGQDIPGSGAGKIGADLAARAAWEIEQGSEELVIAIVDSGFDFSHEDLSEVAWRNPREIAGNGVDDDGNGFIDDVAGWNFVADAPVTSDQGQHGTFVAGVLGMRPLNGFGSRGIAPRARLMIVRFLDEQGSGTTERAVRCIEYAVKNGAKIINLSWGGPEHDPALENVMKWAGERGALIVAAAGNDARDNDTDPHATYPASFRMPHLISVAAYDNQNRLAPFSNYGKKAVDIGAPGVGIFSTIPGGYRFGEGTSFAAPYVSGVAALTWAKFPEWTAAQIKERLLQTSVPLGYYEKENSASGGGVNAFNALTGFMPARPKTPEHWETKSDTTATAHPYPARARQIFTFSVPGANYVRVHFRGFDTERNFDRVVIRDKARKVVVTYSGTLGDFWSAEALGDQLTVEFTSDHSIQAYGFEIDSIAASPDPLP